MFRNIWKKIFLRNLTQTGRDRRIEGLYRLEDPWNLSSTPEQARYRESNSLISNRWPHLDSIIEIGSAEGLQSTYLREIATRIQCVEVSERAASRGRSRNPDVEVYVGNIAGYESENPHSKFDLATAFEVLYYPSHPDEILEPMSRIATHGIASVFSKYVGLVRPHIMKRFDATEQTFTNSGLQWTFWTWSSKQTEP